MKEILFSFVLYLCFLLTVTGCGYKPFPPLREDIRNIYIPTFKNLTWHPGISAKVTDALRREILLDGTFTVTDRKNADAMLIGEVRSLERYPLIYEEGNVIEATAKIKIEARFIFLPSYETLWKEEIHESKYFLIRSLDEEEEIIRSIAERIANKIVKRITEPW